MVDFVTNILKAAGKIQRRVVVSTVDSNTGKYFAFTETNTAFEDLPLRVVSSASIPFIFPHRHIGNNTFMDGGTVWNTNMDSAIDRCREIVGNDDESIIVDIIVCNSNKIAGANDTSNTIGNFLRYRDIKYYNQHMRDLFEFRQAYPKVSFRYFFQPSESLAWGPYEMEFTPDVLGPMIEVGKKDAATILGLGEGASFKKFDEWYVSKELRKQYPHFQDYLHSAN